jgi:cytochrome P450
MLTHPVLPWTPTTPVHLDAESQAWIVCSYADVESVLLRAGDFTWGIWDRTLDPVFAAMWSADGRRHADLRRLVQSCLQARRLRDMTSVVESIANALIDDLLAEGSGRMEVVRQLADPLGGRVVCALLDIDPGDIDRLRGWRRRRHAAINEGRSPELPEARAYYDELIEQRRRRPGHGLLDELIAAQRDGYEVDGAPMSDGDLVAEIMSVLGPGLSGAKVGQCLIGLAGNGLLTSATNDAAAVQGAVEEVLRLYPSLPVVRVRARTDVAVGNAMVPAGDLVHVCIYTANLDPAVFPEPERFDIHRRPNRHLAFGCGAHYCLGAELVRVQTRAALPIVLRRLPNLRLDPSRPVEHRYGRIIGTLVEARFLFDMPVGSE